ncbi:MAG: HAMP domain-containing protein [Planctomycetes bacterium]|nr:HAMP domain-containing protein [Planctomycetota bacterium]
MAPLRSPRPHSRHLFSLGRVLGLAVGLLVVSLGSVCALVLHHLGQMRDDARRVMEETGESNLSTQLVAALEGAQNCAALGGETRESGESVAQRGRVFLGEARGILGRLERVAGAADQTHGEHEAVEQRLFDKIHGGLDQLEAVLAGATPAAGAALASELRSEAHRLAGVFAAENRAEAELANADLLRRVRATSRVMLITVAASAVALCLVLWLVARRIVAPIRTLRDGTERFGRGERAIRIGLRTRDEIGDLAAAFDWMAERVALNQNLLEARVKSMAREVVRAARLAELGTLAAGVAHEINTPLASIASAAEGLQRRIERGELDRADQLEYLRTIAGEAYRAHEITARLLTFARQDRGDVGPVDLRACLGEVERILRHQLEQSGLRLHLDLPESLPAVRSNAGELKQVLLNLLVNARDASPPHSEIRLAARGVDGTVELTVQDQGSGVPSEYLERIFDPFFTTKPPGKGTGLGLALSLALVEGHGGRLEVHNTPGSGACFTLTLPAHPGVAV